MTRINLIIYLLSLLFLASSLAIIGFFATFVIVAVVFSTAGIMPEAVLPITILLTLGLCFVPRRLRRLPGSITLAKQAVISAPAENIWEELHSNRPDNDQAPVLTFPTDGNRAAPQTGNPIDHLLHPEQVLVARAAPYYLATFHEAENAQKLLNISGIATEIYLQPNGNTSTNITVQQTVPQFSLSFFLFATIIDPTSEIVHRLNERCGGQQNAIDSDFAKTA